MHHRRKVHSATCNAPRVAVDIERENLRLCSVARITNTREDFAGSRRDHDRFITRRTDENFAISCVEHLVDVSLSEVDVEEPTLCARLHSAPFESTCARAERGQCFSRGGKVGRFNRVLRCSKRRDIALMVRLARGKDRKRCARREKYERCCNGQREGAIPRDETRELVAERWNARRHWFASECSLEVCCKLGDRLVTPRGVFLERFRENAIEIGAKAIRQRTHLCRCARCGRFRHHTRSRENAGVARDHVRRSAHECFEEHKSERVHITARIGRVAVPELLRTHVLQCSNDARGHRQCERGSAIAVDRFRDSEVDHAWTTIASNEEIRGLEITM